MTEENFVVPEVLDAYEEAPKEKKNTVLWIILIVLAVLFLVCCCAVAALLLLFVPSRIAFNEIFSAITPLIGMM
jgi:flagellar basal body-associated protein FliL